MKEAIEKSQSEWKKEKKKYSDDYCKTFKHLIDKRFELLIEQVESMADITKNMDALQENINRTREDL